MSLISDFLIKQPKCQNLLLLDFHKTILLLIAFFILHSNLLLMDSHKLFLHKSNFFTRASSSINCTMTVLCTWITFPLEFRLRYQSSNLFAHDSSYGNQLVHQLFCDIRVSTNLSPILQFTPCSLRAVSIRVNFQSDSQLIRSLQLFASAKSALLYSRNLYSTLY